MQRRTARAKQEVHFDRDWLDDLIRTTIEPSAEPLAASRLRGLDHGISAVDVLVLCSKRSLQAVGLLVRSNPWISSRV